MAKINLSRRSFLLGATALATASQLPSLSQASISTVEEMGVILVSRNTFLDEWRKLAEYVFIYGTGAIDLSIPKAYSPMDLALEGNQCSKDLIFYAMPSLSYQAPLYQATLPTPKAEKSFVPSTPSWRDTSTALAHVPTKSSQPSTGQG